MIIPRYRRDHYPITFVLLLFLFVSSVSVGAWSWPVDEVDQLVWPTVSAATRNQPNGISLGRSITPSVRYLRYRFSSSGPIDVIAPISGQIVLYDSAFDPDTDRETILLRDDNEFWITIEAERFQWDAPGGIVPDTITVGERLGSAYSVQIVVFDRLRQRYVNPRVMFPYLEDLPDDDIPPLTVVQRGTGVSVPSRGVLDTEVGRVQLISAASDFDPTRLPRTLYILRNGLVEAQYAFTFESQITPLVDEYGNLSLLEAEISPGMNEFEIEARRFDGSIERRTMRLRGIVPEPVLAPNTPPLDTR